MKRTKNKKPDSPIPTPKLNLSPETKKAVAVIIFVLLFIITILSLFNAAGLIGRYISNFLLATFGRIAYAIPIIFLMVGISLSKHKLDTDQQNSFYSRTYIGAFVLIGALAGFIHILYMRNNPYAFDLAAEHLGGGYLGALFAFPFYKLTNVLAGSLVLFALMVIGLLITFDVPLSALIPKFKKVEDPHMNYEVGPIKINNMGKTGFISERVQEKNPVVVSDVQQGESQTQKSIHPTATVPQPKPQVDPNKKVDMAEIILEDRKDWKLPPFDLLEDSKNTVDSGNIEVNVSIIQSTLSNFGIEVEMGEVNVGPTVTQYTLRPATGVKLSQIAALQNDLALALSAHSIRMELPIPGKPLVGIEIPNRTTKKVTLREVLQTEQFVKHHSKLAFGLGRDVSGNAVVTDLSKMPHLLIAGATNSGKSVSVNTFLVSLLYRNTPQDVKFIVVDPKRVEMTVYNGIPHLLTPVITDHEKAVNALKWAVAEMDRRYRLLADVGKRNITEYNEAATIKLPFIIIVIDELADLMMVAKNEVEAVVVRLAQMARAVGIHLVLATQRPSVDVITGLIKANIPARIAFKVTSQVDSRTIIDGSGAEDLLGNGDMLLVLAENPKPRRVQGAFVSGEEVHRVVDFFKKQTGAVIYNEEILERPKVGMSIPGFSSVDFSADGDDMLAEAEAVVRQAGKASASLLQRRLRVGYARAARLLDLLEERGIIGPGDGAKPREVYVKDDLGSVADQDYNDTSNL
jgi:DNA segregation ATPase FtsK/SpoIIIE, S-DNA-T family